MKNKVHQTPLCDTSKEASGDVDLRFQHYFWFRTFQVQSSYTIIKAEEHMLDRISIGMVRAGSESSSL